GQYEPITRNALDRRCVRILRKRQRGKTRERNRQRRVANRCPADHDLRYELTASCVTRHCAPIFFPLRSPASRIDSTSDSATSSICATCAGFINWPPSLGAGDGAEMPGVCCAIRPPG